MPRHGVSDDGAGEARWLEDQGADIVIAQGNGGPAVIAGCFLPRISSLGRGRSQVLLALVPQVVDVVSVPVVAASQIADGRGIAAAFALGAAGVQIGTAYLRCPEAATPPRCIARHYATWAPTPRTL